MSTRSPKSGVKPVRKPRGSPIGRRRRKRAASTTIRIFISSPSDVRPERLKAEQIIARLEREFAYHFHVEAVLWEREPLVAAHHFQDPENIPQPRGTDIVVVILWSRLGLPLPADKFRGAISGRCPVTGTEWEFEDALAGARATGGIPDLLLYRKTASPIAALDDRAAIRRRLDQLDSVEDFFARWFRNCDGEGLSAASHSFADTAEFEQRLYEHLRVLLERRAGASLKGTPIRWPRAPFRALLSYEYEDSPIFFGRTRARNELRELLARQIECGSAFALVFGASGSGKSSLVKAGLLPDLTLPGMIGRVGLARRTVMRPSDAAGDPLAALAGAILSPSALPELSDLQYSAAQLRGLLSAAPDQATLPIRQGLAEAGKAAQPPLTEIAEARLIVVVDQLEEIFTIEGLSESERETFIAVLATLATSGLVWVVATMRSDFFHRLETMPKLMALSAGEAGYLLNPPDEEEIGQIIRQPAQEAGLQFEHDPVSGARLDEAIRRAAASDRGALPLLSFLLDQLWQRSKTGLLTFAAYKELGGLEGAIGRRAEEVFQAQPEEVQRELVMLLRDLATVQAGQPVSRSAPLSRFPEGSPRRALVEAFLDSEARLLTIEDNSGEAQVRLSHEALLSHWGRARDQVDADARDLELRGRLEQEARAWRSARSPREKKGRVITGLQLAEARALLARWGAELRTEIREFIAASRRAAGWRRVRLWSVVAAAPAALAFGVAVVWAGFTWWGVRQVEAEWAANNEFVRINNGCFPMGSPDGTDGTVAEPGRYSNEGPVHQVCLNSFDLGKFEITQAQWRRVMVYMNDADPAQYKGDDRPVESVSWDQAKRFVWLMSLFGRHQYRLPSEAEWEYAARAGTVTAHYWGEAVEDGCVDGKLIYENLADLTLKKQSPDNVVVNCDDGYLYTAPVGKFKPNPWGLFDMLGNVAEWVEDCYVEDYRAAPTDGSPNTAGPCATRVIRGGSWFLNPRRARAAARDNYTPSNRYSVNVGFRVVRVP